MLALTLVREINPNKDREKLCPVWELNPWPLDYLQSMVSVLTDKIAPNKNLICH